MQQMSLSKGQAAHIQRSPISSRLISPIRASYSVLDCTGVDFSVRSPKHNFSVRSPEPMDFGRVFFFFQVTSVALLGVVVHRAGVLSLA
jgi:hypothetical protein